MFNILVVEDDRDTNRYLRAVLEKGGYHAEAARNGREALDMMDTQQYDLIVCDVMMPEMDGYEFMRTLRSCNYDLPTLMVTAKELPEDKRRGFLVGTDDYMVKPIDPMEMLLRVKALLRRAKIVSDRRITVGDVVLDYNALSVSRKETDGGREETVTLPPKEFYLLYKLMAYPDQIFTRMQLMDEVWGLDSTSDFNTVNVHINRLRNRFKDWPEFDIVTVRGVGYKAVKNA